jgi:hypothetical protein
MPAKSKLAHYPVNIPFLDSVAPARSRAAVTDRATKNYPPSPLISMTPLEMPPPSVGAAGVAPESCTSQFLIVYRQRRMYGDCTRSL